MSAGRGMPLLSGPAPSPNANEGSCRKCSKEFNILFARSRKCNHCGYAYCHSCTDYQALMPRSGNESGYDPMPVCAYCVENLTITAGGKSYLRSLPLSRLKKYANGYNIKVNGVLEKDEFIDTLIAARRPNGCLPSGNEEFYRKYSVPNKSAGRPRGMFARAFDAMGADRPQAQQPPLQRPPYQPRSRTTSHPSSFPRPDLDPRNQRHQYPQQPYSQPQYHNQYQYQYPHAPSAQYAPPPGQLPSHYQQYAPPSGHPHPASFPQSGPNLNVPNPSPNQQARPRSASAPRTPQSASRTTSPPRSPPIPGLDELLEMSQETISALSIGSLKGILFRYHVNARLVVEKGELVTKVMALVEDERRERSETLRRAEEEERQLREIREQAERERMEGETARNTADQATSQVGSEQAQSQPSPGDEHGNGGDTPMEGVEETNANSTQHQETAPSDPTATPKPPTSATSSPAPVGKMSPKAQAMASHLERTGLCVICQDEEANIAIVDCGHLAMCRACSDLIMSSTRECPLCRTRIVTEARLLRIFKS